MEIENIRKDSFKEKYTFKKIKGVPLFELFHRNSEINSLNADKFSNVISNALSDKEFWKEWSDEKDLYSDRKIIKLPNPNEKLADINIFDVIKKRRSVRNFTNEAITLEELSTILHYSSGLTGEYYQTKEKNHMYLFAYPSAGGLMPLDLYIFVTNVKDIDSGIYYYNPIKHCLKVVKDNLTFNELKKITLSLNLSLQAAFSVYILGRIYLTGYKYGDRGYRFMLLEAGHLAQNLYLTSTAIGAGAVASGGFLDGDILELLELNETETFVIYEIFIGKPNLKEDYRFIPKI